MYSKYYRILLVLGLIATGCRDKYAEEYLSLELVYLSLCGSEGFRESSESAGSGETG